MHLPLSFQAKMVNDGLTCDLSFFNLSPKCYLSVQVLKIIFKAELFNIWCSFHFSYSHNFWNKAFRTTVQNTSINNTKISNIWSNLRHTTFSCFALSFSFTLALVQPIRPIFVRYLITNIQLYLVVCISAKWLLQHFAVQ